MNITLTFYRDDKKESKIELSKNRITVGRDATCDVVINDTMVSGIHFVIFAKDNMVYLEDNNSLNGTYLNGKSISGQTTLGKKGEISFCSNKLEFSIDSDITVEKEVELSEDQMNKTMISMKVPDLQKKKNPLELLKSRKVVIGLISFFAISLMLILLIPSGSGEKQTKNPFKARMIDSYFIQFDDKISATITDRNSLANAENYYKIGKDKLKQKDLNRESIYEALILFIKAKESVMDMKPKPEIWDSINPELIKTKNQLKSIIKQLYTDAWFAEKKGDKDKAAQIYGFVLDTLPDPESAIFKNTEIRINRLK